MAPGHVTPVRGSAMPQASRDRGGASGIGRGAALVTMTVTPEGF